MRKHENERIRKRDSSHVTPAQFKASEVYASYDEDTGHKKFKSKLMVISESRRISTFLSHLFMSGLYIQEKRSRRVKQQQKDVAGDATENRKA